MNMLNLSKEESINLLNLRKEHINKLNLSKPQMNQKARVAIAVDYSGSMRSFYKDGTVQAILEKILPIALEFDDNGTLDVWLFDDYFRRMPGMNINNYYDYVQKEILDKRYHMGGTNYAPVINDIKKFYIDEEPELVPNYILFVTDGDNFDKRATTETIKEISEYPIFWQFVGIGKSEFTYLEKLDDLKDRYVDNADFFSVSNIKDFYEKDSIYEYLLNEYPNWLEYPEVKDMLTNGFKKSSEQKSSEKKRFFGLF